MVKTYLITLFTSILLANLCFGQLRDKEKSIQTDHFKSVLEKGSLKRKSDKRYYEQQNYLLKEGERFHFTISSRAANVIAEFWLRDSALLYTINGRPSGPSFVLNYAFTADSTDSFTVKVLTKEPKAETEYRFKYLITGPRLSGISTDSLFCDKVEYLIAHTFLDFEWIIGDVYGQDANEALHYSNLIFNPNQPSKFHSSRNGIRYVADFEKVFDFEEAKTIFENQKRAINTCLAEYGEIKNGTDGIGILQTKTTIQSESFKGKKAYISLDLIEISESYLVQLSIGNF